MCDQGPEETLLRGISANAAGSFPPPRFTLSNFVMYISCVHSLFIKEFSQYSHINGPKSGCINLSFSFTYSCFYRG